MKKITKTTIYEYDIEGRITRKTETEITEEEYTYPNIFPSIAPSTPYVPSTPTPIWVSSPTACDSSTEIRYSGETVSPSISVESKWHSES